jgi:alpha-glucosidase
VLYYGDEIGMTDVTVPPELARDTLGGDSARPSRDRARTPMQWDDSPAGGFTAAGIRGWLPSGDVTACNVAAQRRDPNSVLSFCRELLRLRRAEIGRLGGYQPLPAPEGVWHYSAGGLAVAANLTGRWHSLPGAAGQVLLSSLPGRDHGDQVTLAPWEGVIAARQQ